MSALLDQILHKFSATTFVQISPTIDTVPGKTPELANLKNSKSTALYLDVPV